MKFEHKVVGPSGQRGDAFDPVITAFIVGCLRRSFPIYTAARSVPCSADWLALVWEFRRRQLVFRIIR